MLNLAMTNTADGGWPIGNINTMPGQSSAGKTVEVLSTFSEASLDRRFKDYALIYDDVERRCDFNLPKLFSPVLERLTTPSGLLYKDLQGREDESGISNTIQDLKSNMLQLKQSKKKFIYIADSLDSFTTDEELIKEMRRAMAAAKTKEAAEEIKGSYNTEKAKILGQILRMINGVVADTDSLFILTQQLRQRINPGFGQSDWVTSGGESPYYYSQVRPLFIKKASIKEGRFKIGTHVRVAMDKNSILGKLTSVEFDIFADIGIDDTGSMVNFLCDEKHWEAKGSWIEAPELELKAQGRENLVLEIEGNDMVSELRKVTEEVWNKLVRDADASHRRKPRYGRV